MISVTMVGANAYLVELSGSAYGNVEYRYTVTLTPDYHRKLTGGRVTQEWLIVSTFRFLLENEPVAALRQTFALEDVRADYPDYEVAMTARLAPN